VVDAQTIVEKFRATFETYWADTDFELYDPALHRDRLDRAVAGAREEPSSDIVFFDIQPWPHHREILERLHVERYRHLIPNVVGKPCEQLPERRRGE